MITQLTRDVQYAWRTIIHNRILSAVVIVSLGVGIGVNTVVFSWIQALVFRPLPGVADASRFYLIEARAENNSRPGSSWLEYRDLHESVRAMPDLMAFRMVPVNLGEVPPTERVYALLVSGNYFSTLDLRAAMGRLLRPDEVVPAGGARVTVISFDFWQTRLGGAATVVGQTLRINGHDLTIVGVAPEGFQGTVLGLQFDLWMPATLAPVVLNGSRELEERAVRGYYVMGTLGPDHLVSEAQTQVDSAMRQLAEAYPASNAVMRAEVVEFWRASRGPQLLLVQGLTILQAIMLVLLLAVCGNTANLLLARATARQREIGIRLAVGAGWWRIARLLLIESAVLGVFAAALGAAIAMWGTQALRAMPIFTTAFPVRFQTSVNEAGLTFALLLGIICAVIFGTAPAIQLARIDPQMTLRTGSQTTPPRRLRQILMAVEVAFAMVVLLAAGLFLQSFRETREDPGFRRDGVLLAAYDLTGRNLEAAAARDFAERLLAKVRLLPGVEAAAIATQVPLDIHGLPLREFVLEGRARTDGAPDRVLTNVVTPGYFRTMNIPVLAGTDFAQFADVTSPAQAIVNEAFVRRYLGNVELRDAGSDLTTALGRRVEIARRTYAIAAVVRNSLYESFSESPTPIVYMSYRDRPSQQGEIHVWTEWGHATTLAAGIRNAVREVDQSVPIYNVRTLTEHIDTNLALRRIPARMFGVLGPLLLVLAAIGIYAVVAYTVAHRTTEIGVRLALGATANGVVTQIVRESLVVIVGGGAIGWAFVWAIYTRLFRGSIDMSAFIGVPLILMTVAAMACWLPAHRASRLDPLQALRTE